MQRKHFLLPLVILMIIATIGALSTEDKTYSQDLDPIVASQCEKSSKKECCLQYNEAIESTEQDWKDNLQTLVDQQKPASEMVDEAYENLRTYNCWLEYICRSVQYSGYAPIESVLGTAITSKHVGQAPGCQKPEDIKLETHYGSFAEKLNSVPILGSTIAKKENLYMKDKINYFPACMTDEKNNTTPNFVQMSNNFEGCKSAIEAKFGCSGDLPPDQFEACVNGDENAPSSTSVTIMETALKKANADQRASALEQKIGDLATKLHGMESQVTYLSNYLTQLDQRLACVIRRCT